MENQDNRPLITYDSAGVQYEISAKTNLGDKNSAKNITDILKQLLPPADHKTGYLNATQIGEKLGLGKGTNAGRKANIRLEDAAFQYKEGRDWRLTKKGAVYGEEMPYTRNGHSGYQIRWNDNVLDALRSG